MSGTWLISDDGPGVGSRPFDAVCFAYGMMLGDADLNDAFAHANGQQHLASAWQHGSGVIWGFPVEFDHPTGEIRVGSGLASDGVGRFVSHRGAAQCVSVGAWWDSPGRPHVTNRGSVDHPVFDLWVIARYDACPTGPVPVLAATCGTSIEPGDVADSRLIEGARFELRGSSPPGAPVRYPQLLALLRACSESGGFDEGPEVFHHLAAADSAALRPVDVSAYRSAGSDFPEADDCVVVLAKVADVTLQGGPGAWAVAGGRVELDARRVLLDTGTIQDLLADALAAPAAAPVDPATAALAADPPPAGPGPRIAGRPISFGDGEVRLAVRGSVDPTTFTKDAIFFTALTPTGWTDVVCAPGSVGSDELSITYEPVDAASWYRLILMGRGRRPLVGTNENGEWGPLAGADGDPPSPDRRGADFVCMKEC